MIYRAGRLHGAAMPLPATHVSSSATAAWWLQQRQRLFLQHLPGISRYFKAVCMASGGGI
jgi:hypothetical protein